MSSLLPNNWASVLLKPVTVGTAGAIITSFYNPSGGHKTISIYGRDISIPIVAFVGFTVGSMAAELLNKTLYPNLPKEYRAWSSPVSEVVSVIAIAGIDLLIWYIANSNSIQELSLVMILITAVGAELVGSYIYDKFIAPMISAPAYTEVN